MKCGKPYCACVGECFAQQSPLATEAERPTPIEFANQVIKQQAAEIERISKQNASLYDKFNKAQLEIERLKAEAFDSTSMYNRCVDDIHAARTEIERLQLAVALKNGAIKTLQDEANDARLGVERANELLRRCEDGFSGFIMGRLLKRKQRDKLRADIQDHLWGSRWAY